MKIFVAYGYHERDLWVKELVFPLIQAFGSEVVTGEETYDGPNIPDNVIGKIRRSDALIGFTTRRSSQNNVNWQTHQWVINELAAAFTLKRRVLEVRECGVDPQGGLTQNLQRIDYDETKREKCLVEIVKALGIWHQMDTVKIQLLPEDVANNDLRPLLDDQGLSCKYIIRIGNYEDGPFDAQIKPIKGGLFLDAPSVPRDALIRISIRYGNRAWASDYESIDSYGIHLK